MASISSSSSSSSFFFSMVNKDFTRCIVSEGLRSRKVRLDGIGSNAAESPTPPRPDFFWPVVACRRHHSRIFSGLWWLVDR
eukprot:g730.t1